MGAKTSLASGIVLSLKKIIISKKPPGISSVLMDRVIPTRDNRLHPWEAFLFEQAPEMPCIKKLGAPSSSSNSTPCATVFLLDPIPNPVKLAPTSASAV